MNENIIDHLRCSPLLWSTEDHKTPQKRQKLNPLRPSSLHNTSSGDSLLNYEGKYRRLEAELEIIRARLYQSEITAMRLHKVRKEIEEIFEREKIVLQMQVKSDNELIEQLREELEVATKRAEEAREAEVAAESEMFQMKTTMEQQVSELLLEIARLKELISSNCENTPTPSESQGDDAEVLKKKLKIAEEQIIRLEDKLKDNRKSQTEPNSQGVELELNAERTSWEMREAALISSAKNFEEQQGSSNNVISTSPEAVKQDHVLEGKMQDELKGKEMLKHQVKVQQKKCEELSPKQSSAAPKYMSRYQQTESLSMERERLSFRVDNLQRNVVGLEQKTEKAMKVTDDNNEANNGGFDVELFNIESMDTAANEVVPWQGSDGHELSSKSPCDVVAEGLEIITEIARLTNTVPSNCGVTPTLSKSQEDEAVVLAQKLKAAEEQIIDLEPQLEDNCAAKQVQVEIDVPNMMLGEASIILFITTIMSRAETLHELDSLDSVYFTLSQAVRQKDYLREQISNIRKKLRDREKLRQKVKILQEKCQKLSPNRSSAVSEHMVSRYQQTEPISMRGENLRSRIDDLERKVEVLEGKTEEAIKVGQDPNRGNRRQLDAQMITDTCQDAAVHNEIPRQADDESLLRRPSDQVDENSLEAVQREPLAPNLLLRVGIHYVLPSDEKFFKIKWENEYTCKGKYHYVCNRCQIGGQRKTKMEDHVWLVHYGGCFKCPTCYLHYPSCLGSRNNIAFHVDRIHPLMLRARERKHYQVKG